MAHILCDVRGEIRCGEWWGRKRQQKLLWAVLIDEHSWSDDHEIPDPNFSGQFGSQTIRGGLSSCINQFFVVVVKI